MANPITWRNVGSRGGAGSASSLLAGAQDSLNSGLDRLTGLIGQRQSTQANNWKVRRDNNTQDFLNQLNQFRTPEEFQAAREQGLLQDAMGQYGRQIDQGAARTALDERLGVLQQRNTATQAYRDDQTSRDNRGLRGQITDLVLDGQQGKAEALFDANADSFVDPAAERRQLFADLKGRNSENRAQAGERRAQRSDARAGARFNREQEGWQTSDAANDALGAAWDRMQNLGEGETASSVRRELTDTLTGLGVAPSEATKLAGNFDQAVSSYGAVAGVDQELIDRGQAELDRDYNIATNEFLQPQPEDPTAAANEMLADFEDEDGNLFGNGDPEERLEFSRQAAQALRSEVTLDNGDTIQITPAILRGALNGVKGSFGDLGNKIPAAVKDYIQNSPDLLQRHADAKEYREKSRTLNGAANAALGSGYRLTWRDLAGPQ